MGTGRTRPTLPNLGRRISQIRSCSSGQSRMAGGRGGVGDGGISCRWAIGGLARHGQVGAGLAVGLRGRRRGRPDRGDRAPVLGGADRADPGPARPGRGAGHLTPARPAATLGAGRPLLRLAGGLARRSAGAAHRLEDRLLLPRTRLLPRRVLALPVPQRARPSGTAGLLRPGHHGAVGLGGPVGRLALRVSVGRVRTHARLDGRAGHRSRTDRHGGRDRLHRLGHVHRHHQLRLPRAARARRAVDHEHLPGGAAAAGARGDRRTRPPARAVASTTSSTSSAGGGAALEPAPARPAL